MEMLNNFAGWIPCDDNLFVAAAPLWLFIAVLMGYFLAKYQAKNQKWNKAATVVSRILFPVVAFLLTAFAIFYIEFATC